MFRYVALAVSCLGAIGLFAPVAPAQDAADQPAKQSAEPGAAIELRQLVQQLGDPSNLVRDAAAVQLLRQGAAAKDVLTEALTDRDLEIRTRAGLILGQLEQKPLPDNDAAERTRSPGPTAVQRDLVQQLGDTSFFLREEATKKLTDLGPAGKLVLLEALSDPDLEIRRRVRWILKRVLEEEFEARLVAFVADADGEQQHDLPGWERFRELAGHGRDARQMFAAMMRSDGALLSAYGKQSPVLSDLFVDRAAWLQSPVARNGNSVTPQAVATLLFIGSDKSIKNQSQTASQLYQLLNYSATKVLIDGGDHSSIVYALLEEWVMTASSSGSSFGMMMALKYELKETAFELAKKLIDGGTSSTSTLHYAIITVGKFGDKEHVPLLTPLLENKTICHRWSNQQLKKNGTINVEVRDAALVVILHLLGRDPKQYGFNLLREHKETLYYTYTFGFVEDSEREAVHAKWVKESGADEE